MVKGSFLRGGAYIKKKMQDNITFYEKEIFDKNCET